MPQLPTPAFLRDGGFCSSNERIIIRCSVPGCVLYYTRDGTNPVPGENGTHAYNVNEHATVIVDGTYPTADHGVLKAIATKSGYDNSAVATSQPYYYYCADMWTQYICSYITKAVNGLVSGNKTVTLYYSFVMPGVKIETVNIAKPLSRIAGITAEQFKQSAITAMIKWKSYFESIFNPANSYNGQLTLSFEPAPNSINGGEETNNNIYMDSGVVYPIPNASGAGDIRFAIADLGNDDGLLSSLSSYVVVNGSRSTVLDGQATGGNTTNLDFTLLHKLGHVLSGLIDDKDGNFAKLMACKWSTLPIQQQNPSAYNLSALFPPNGVINATNTSWEKLMVERRHTTLAPNRPIVPAPVFEPSVSAIYPGQRIGFSIPYD